MLIFASGSRPLDATAGVKQSQYAVSVLMQVGRIDVAMNQGANVGTKKAMHHDKGVSCSILVRHSKSRAG